MKTRITPKIMRTIREALDYLETREDSDDPVEAARDEAALVQRRRHGRRER